MRHPAFIILLLAGLPAAAAGGQEVGPTGEILDPVSDERGILGESLQRLEPGLRSPSEFENLYVVPGAPHLRMRVDGGLYAIFPQSQFVATNAGAVAVVPNNTVFFIGAPDPALLLSHYGQPGVMTRSDAAGRRALLGLPPTDVAPIASAFRSDASERIGMRVEARVAESPVPHEGAERSEGIIARSDLRPLQPVRVEAPRWSRRVTEPGPTTIVTDEAYLRDRLHHLMRWAARVRP